MKYVKLLPLVIVPFMMSACGQPERPRVVSDFCLLDKTISADPSPRSGADDPGNTFDTDQTVAEVIAHNAVHRSTCTTPPAP